MDKSETYRIKILKHNRVWSKILIVEGDGSQTRFARAKKKSVSAIPEGQTVEMEGCLDIQKDKYKTTIEFLPASAEFVPISETEAKNLEIERWIGYFRETFEDRGYIYERSIEELHALGCHDYDEEIAEARVQMKQKEKQKSIDRWIGYFRENFRDSRYFYERAVNELHALGCHDYDEEIANTKAQIEKEERQKSIDKWWRLFQEKAEDGIYYDRAVCELHALSCHDYDEEMQSRSLEIRRIHDEKVAAGEAKKRLVLPAYWGYRGKPGKGMRLMDDGVPYCVESSYYHAQDGFSIGVMSEAWYEVWAYNISNTEEGQQMIADHEASLAKAKREKEREKARSGLEKMFQENGKRYEGPDIHLCDLTDQATILDDTSNAYGGGHWMLTKDDSAWLVINNGSDGDFWGINNILTAGAGAYALVMDIDTFHELADPLLEKL